VEQRAVFLSGETALLRMRFVEIKTKVLNRKGPARALRKYYDEKFLKGRSQAYRYCCTGRAGGTLLPIVHFIGASQPHCDVPTREPPAGLTRAGGFFFYG
jgi:hypothetical protein